MRHGTLLLAALIGAAGLTGCGGTDPSNPTAAADTAGVSVDTKDRRIASARGTRDGVGSSAAGTASATSGNTSASTSTSGTTSGATSGGAVAAASGAVSGATGALIPAPPVGRLLAANCFACHGTNGRPAGGFDRLAGESASEIYGTLREMAVKTDEGIMGVHARGYSDTQLWQLATYFSQQR